VLRTVPAVYDCENCASAFTARRPFTARASVRAVRRIRRDLRADPTRTIRARDVVAEYEGRVGEFVSPTTAYHALTALGRSGTGQAPASLGWTLADPEGAAGAARQTGREMSAGRLAEVYIRPLLLLATAPFGDDSVRARRRPRKGRGAREQSPQAAPTPRPASLPFAGQQSDEHLLRARRGRPLHVPNRSDSARSERHRVL
jgi:hypothetical protein